MRQKIFFDGTAVPAVWQGGSNVTHVDMAAQAAVWVDGVRAGCTAIDTSELYGLGRSERIVAEVLKKVSRDDVFVATKAASDNLGRVELIYACERSLKRLGVDCIDLYQVHWTNPYVPLEDTMDAMLQLRAEGKIRYIGVCNLILPQIELCYNHLLGGALASVQMEYNLINRSCETNVIPYCEERGILFLGYSPFNEGRVNYENTVLKTIADKHGKTVKQVILNWLTLGESVATISRTKHSQYVVKNSQATDFVLDENDRDSIDSSFKSEIVFIEPAAISCENTMSGVEGSTGGYKSVEEAIENRLNLVPTPLSLSKEIESTKQLPKPLFVHSVGDCKYELDGGLIRYWAWVIAFGVETPVECIVLKEKY